MFSFSVNKEHKAFFFGNISKRSDYQIPHLLCYQNYRNFHFSKKRRPLISPVGSKIFKIDCFQAIDRSLVHSSALRMWGCARTGMYMWRSAVVLLIIAKQRCVIRSASQVWIESECIIAFHWGCNQSFVEALALLSFEDVA